MSGETLAYIKQRKIAIKNAIYNKDKRYKVIPHAKAKSSVWKAFNLIEYNGEIIKYVQCKICSEVLIHCGKSGTGALLRHTCYKNSQFSLPKTGKKLKPISKKCTSSKLQYANDARPFARTTEEGRKLMETFNQSVGNIAAAHESQSSEDLVIRYKSLVQYDKELPDQADDSHSNFGGSFSNIENPPMHQQAPEAQEMFNIIEPPSAGQLPMTPREKQPNAKRQKRMASEIYDYSYNENFENSENIENIENIPPNNQQTFEYTKWKEERYDLFGKMVLMKMHDITNDAQRCLAEKFINEALSLAELNLLTPSYVLNAPFVPLKAPTGHRTFSRPRLREHPVIPLGVQNRNSPRNGDAVADARTEPEFLEDNHQNISPETNIASPTTPPPLQTQNIATNQQSTPSGNLKKTTPTTAPTTAATTNTATATATASAQTKTKIEHPELCVPAHRDASDDFGQHVGNKHRQYTDYIKSFVEHEISQVLFEADMGKYEQPLEGNWQQQQQQQGQVVQQQQLRQRRPSAKQGINANGRGSGTTNKTNAPSSSGAKSNLPTAAATTIHQTKASSITRLSTSSANVASTSANAPPRPSTSAGAIAHSRTNTAQHSNATSVNAEADLLDPNIVIKSSPAHTPSYSSDMDDNDDESQTVLPTTRRTPYVTNERMMDDDEEILSSYNG